jgi:hypothetical protein
MFNLSVLHVWFKTFGCITLYVQPDIKYWQVEHTVWFNIKVLNQTWSTDKLNIQEDSIQKFWTEQVEHTWLVSTSCLVQNFWLIDWLIDWLVFSNQRAIFQLYSGREHLIWMESPCMFNLSVLHIWWWFNIKVLNQTWSTDKLNIQGDSIQKFWTRHEVLTSWTYRVIHSKSSICQYFMSGSKLLYWITLFNLSVLYVWFKTFGCNHPVCSTCQYFMSGSKPCWTYRVFPSKSFEPDMKNRQFEHTGWFHPKVFNQTWSTDKYFWLNYPVCLIIPPLPEGGGGYTVLPLSVCPSVRPRYLSSHFSQ